MAEMKLAYRHKRHSREGWAHARWVRDVCLWAAVAPVVGVVKTLGMSDVPGGRGLGQSSLSCDSAATRAWWTGW